MNATDIGNVPSQLNPKASGKTCSEAKQEGYSCRDVQIAGYSAGEAQSAGYTAEEASKAGYATFQISHLVGMVYCQQYDLEDKKRAAIICTHEYGPDPRGGPFISEYSYEWNRAARPGLI